MAMSVSPISGERRYKRRRQGTIREPGMWVALAVARTMRMARALPGESSSARQRWIMMGGSSGTSDAALRTGTDEIMTGVLSVLSDI